MRTIGLIGNPNCGKTTIFNGLTGSNQHIGNWPGVTVEKKSGIARLPSKGENDSEEVTVVDLPGVYSLNATSEDERATLEYILSREANLYVNVLDATALERNLYLTLLMCELKVPMIVVVTMMDVARHRNIEIELEHLSEHLGVPVIGINANNPLGIRKLRSLLSSRLTQLDSLIPSIKLEYGNELAQEIDILSSCTIKTAEALKVSREWVALKALEGEPFVTKALLDYHDMAPEVLSGAIQRVTEVLADPPDIELAEVRYGIIAGLVHDVVHRHQSKMYFSEIIDRFVLNRFLGLPLFLVVMAGVFALVSGAGGWPTELFEKVGGCLFEDLPNMLAVEWFGKESWVTRVVGGMGGAFTVLFSFVPVIFCMFFALAILEDSGYMSRAAFLADRLMRSIGLPGKSFVPLLVGFGCSVPAIMATRTLESKRDRMLTIFMIPFMSCGAKLPVYAAFAAVFSPEAPWKMLIALYLVGVVLGIFSGFVLKKTLFCGTPAHFIMELPPYHCPRPKHILFHTWERLWGFLWRAGKFIVPMMFLLGLLNTFTVSGCIAERTTERTMLAEVGRTLTPAFEPIGVESSNWQASVAILTGLFAKESVIGTMTGLYSQEAGLVKGGEFWEGGADALRSHFPRGFHQVFAYLLFILLYVPCVGATAVVFKEIGKLYGAIFVVYQTVLGWSVASIYHAIMVSHSLVWLLTSVWMIVAMFALFALYGRHHRTDISELDGRR